MAKLLANSGDPDQMPHAVASDLSLHCLPVTLLGVFRLKWVKSHQEFHSPSQDEGSIWIVSAGPRGTPLDCVNFFTVGL